MIPINPKPIFCDIEGSPTPTYTWKSTKTNFGAVTGRTLLISMKNSRERGDVELITCTTSVEGVGKSCLMVWY